MSTEFYWIALAAIIVTSASRLTRLLTWDEFPPTKAMRDAFANFTDANERRRRWQILAFCGYCMSFWMTALVVGWADLAGVFDGRTAWGTTGEVATPVWFLVNGTLGASYLAAILMVHDGDNGDDTEGEG